MKISLQKREKIYEQILAHLYSVSPKSLFTLNIASEIARDEEFVKSLLLELKKKGLVEIIEKPKKWISDYAITGLYLYDKRVVEIAEKLKPSERGELEIVDLHKWYLEQGELDVSIVKGIWEDAGTFDSLLAVQQLAKDKLQDKMVI